MPLPNLTLPKLSTVLLFAALAALAPDALAQVETPAAPQTQEELMQQYQDTMKAAQTAAGEEDWDEALKQASRAIALTGGQRPETLLLRAIALKELEEYEGALEDLKEALNYAGVVPGLEPQIRNARAEVYLEVGAPDLALKDAQLAVKAQRNVPGFQFNYGKALLQSGGVVQAKKAITKYIDAAEAAEEKDEERLAEAYRLRAQASGSVRKFDSALEDIERSLALAPEEHESYFIRGQVYLQEKDYEKAADAFANAIENYSPQDPEDDQPYTEAILIRASALEEFGKQADDPAVAAETYREVKTTTEQLLEELPEYSGARAATLFRLGVAERLLGNLREAVAAFSKAINLNPAFGEAYFRRGICFFYLGEPRLALADFEQGAAINYDSPRSNLWKGRSYAALGEYREAIKAYSQSIAVSDRYVAAFEHRGLAYLTLDEYDNAIADFNEAIRLDPSKGEPYYYRGVAQAREGERRRAIESLSYAVEFAPELAPAYALLAELLRAAGRDDLASEYARRAAELESAGN